MTYEEEPVKKAVAEADLFHASKHALVEIIEARTALLHLRERVAGPGHDADHAFEMIDAQLRDAARFLREQKCNCGGNERVTLAFAAPTPEDIERGYTERARGKVIDLGARIKRHGNPTNFYAGLAQLEPPTDDGAA